MLLKGLCFRIGSISLALCFLYGCLPESGPFDVIQFLQDGRTDVKLNEPLVFRFSAPVDPTSVNSSSVLIEDGEGVPAQGDWHTSGREVRFQPAYPVDAHYTGAGLRFGKRYSIVFAGYPIHGTVLSTRGSVLSSRTVFAFSTVKREDAQGLYDAFSDPSPSESPRLLSVNGIPIREIPYQGIEIPPEEGFTMEFSEPLHPATVLDGALRFVVLNEEGVSPAGAGVVPLLCSFAAGSENRVVRAVPREPLERGKRYNLNYESLGFTDFGGNGIRGDDFSFIQFRCRE